MHSPSSVESLVIRQAVSVVSPKCVEPVQPVKTPDSSFSGETVHGSELLMVPSQDGPGMGRSLTEDGEQQSRTRPSVLLLPEAQDSSLTPVKRSVSEYGWMVEG